MRSPCFFLHSFALPWVEAGSWLLNLHRILNFSRSYRRINVFWNITSHKSHFRHFLVFGKRHNLAWNPNFCQRLKSSISWSFLPIVYSRNFHIMQGFLLIAGYKCRLNLCSNMVTACQHHTFVCMHTTAEPLHHVNNHCTCCLATICA